MRQEPVSVLGHRMFVDDEDTLGLAKHGIYEPMETRVWLELLKPGDIAFDIGANIGYYTLLFSRAVGPAGRVFAFEPDPSNFTLLERNLELNNLRNVTPVCQAVGAAKGSVSLYLSEENRGDHHIYQDGEERARIEVECTSIDDYFGDRDLRIGAIKMDIQGAEALALQGMQRTLLRNPSVQLITEFWPSGLCRAGTTPREFLEGLLGMGFQFVNIRERERTWLYTVLNGLLQSVGYRKAHRRRLLERWSETRAGPRIVRPGAVESIEVERLLRRFTPRNCRHTNLLWSREGLDPCRGLS